MAESATEHKTLSLLVDNTNFLKNVRGDVIVDGGPELPPVISPKKFTNKARASTSTDTIVQDEDCEGAEEEETDIIL